MANVQYYDVILKPVVTEKSMNAMAEKKYTFLVHPEANKTMIKEAVEKMFEGTKVASVNTMNLDIVCALGQSVFFDVGKILVKSHFLTPLFVLKM